MLGKKFFIMVLQLSKLHTYNRSGASIFSYEISITKTILLQIFFALELTLDVTEAYNSVQNVAETPKLVKKEVADYHTRWYSNAVELAAKVEVVPTVPKITATMRHCANIHAENEESYFKKNLTIPILGEVYCSIVQA